jgi:hypothetical protein
MSPEASKGSHVDPSQAPCPSAYTAILLTTLVVLVLGILIAHAFMVAKLNDQLSAMNDQLDAVGSIINSGLSSMNSQVGRQFTSMAAAIGNPTVTITPGTYATFTMAAAP